MCLYVFNWWRQEIDSLMHFKYCSSSLVQFDFRIYPIFRLTFPFFSLNINFINFVFMTIFMAEISKHLHGWSWFHRFHHGKNGTWWLIPLSKWVITLITPKKKWINPTYPIYNWGYNIYNPLTSRGMSHQASTSPQLRPDAKRPPTLASFRRVFRSSLPRPRSRMSCISRSWPRGDAWRTPKKKVSSWGLYEISLYGYIYI